jgi:hypothetical protein
MLVAIALYVFLLKPATWHRLIWLIAVAVIARYLFLFIVVTDPFFFPWTEEGIIIGYYLFLGFALIKRNPYLIGIACSMCFLSRYVLLAWVPVYLIYLFLYEDRKKSIKAAAVFATIVLFVFVLPFFIEQPAYFILVPGETYKQVAQTIWTTSPELTYNGVSALRFFNIGQINLIHHILVLVTFITPLIAFAIFYMLRRYSMLNKDYFGFSSLKLTMIFFYIFIDAPFPYLFFVPVFFSIAIIFKAMRD